MSCQRVDFKAYNGLCLKLGFPWIVTFTSTNKTNGSVIDISGRSYQMIIRETAGGADLLTVETIGNATDTGFYLSDPANGVKKVRINPAEATTAGLVEKDYLYRIVETDASGDEDIYMEGTLEATTGVFA